MWLDDEIHTFLVEMLHMVGLMKFIHFWLKCCIWLDDEIHAFLVEVHMVGLMKIHTFLVEMHMIG
jgi:hypothetical protein